MKSSMVMMLLVLLAFPLDGRTEKEQQISELERALMRVQQDAQATHQQFLMIQELRRHEMLGSQLAEFPDVNIKSGPAPEYEEALQQQQDRRGRIEKYTVDLDRLYARFRALEEERQMLMEQINQLQRQQSE
ncbi:hypothetical protein SAMN05216326_12353 [Nitrosomonas marina]|uniref:Uncharacterized protein n=1 Tax=Nitrosomonas marina TaxID=917 RepID=A0A1I0DZA2_9PROT|nr:hypothetical protein [Nitrosomonas marina]SET37632.1 hypothetical protein SAMN05216326_12353 [Nitrosomonas marina]